MDTRPELNEKLLKIRKNIEVLINTVRDEDLSIKIQEIFNTNDLSSVDIKNIINFGEEDYNFLLTCLSENKPLTLNFLIENGGDPNVIILGCTLLEMSIDNELISGITVLLSSVAASSLDFAYQYQLINLVLNHIPQEDQINYLIDKCKFSLDDLDKLEKAIMEQYGSLDSLQKNVLLTIKSCKVSIVKRQILEEEVKIDKNIQREIEYEMEKLKMLVINGDSHTIEMIYVINKLNEETKKYLLKEDIELYQRFPNFQTNVDIKDDKGQTLFEFACSLENPELYVLKTLIESGANMTNVNKETKSKINLLVEGNDTLANILCYSQNINNDYLANYFKEFLLDDIENVRRIFHTGQNHPYSSPIQNAIVNRKIEENTILTLLNELKSVFLKSDSKSFNFFLNLPNPKSGFKKTSLLHLACEHRSSDLIKLLIDLGSNVNCMDYFGKTPLHVYCGRKKYSISALNRILKETTDPNAQDVYGKTALHYLCQNPKVQIKSILTLLQNGIDVTIKDKKNLTAIDYLKQNFSDEDIFKFHDKNGRNLLHYAFLSQKPNFETIQFFYDNGVAFKEKDTKGNLPYSQNNFKTYLAEQRYFQLSRDNSNLEILVYLLDQQNTDLNLLKVSLTHSDAKEINAAFELIIEKKPINEKLLELVLEIGKDNINNENIISTLHEACRSGNKNIIELLINYSNTHQKNIINKEINNFTPLMQLIKAKNVNEKYNIAKFLLDKGAKLIGERASAVSVLLQNKEVDLNLLELFIKKYPKMRSLDGELQQAMNKGIFKDDIIFLFIAYKVDCDDIKIPQKYADTRAAECIRIIQKIGLKEFLEVIRKKIANANDTFFKPQPTEIFQYLSKLPKEDLIHIFTRNDNEFKFNY